MKNIVKTLQLIKVRAFTSHSLSSALETAETRFVRLSEEEPQAVELAVHLLRAGRLLALPTDTVYGLAAAADNPDAVQQLYHVKGRENAKPLAICVGRVEDVHKWGIVSITNQLLNSLLPGPVTLLLHPQPGHLLPLPENPKLVGIRVPNHEFSCAVAKKLGVPIALTSANISGQPSSLNPEEFRDIWPKLSAVFDGGSIGGNQASRSGSTVLDLSKEGWFRIVRAGIDCDRAKRLLLANGLQENL